MNIKSLFLANLFMISAGICYTQDINITTYRDLDFQMVIPGVPKTVTETQGNSGKFTISKTGTLPVTVYMNFSLPQSLIPISGQKGISNSVPITFTATKSQDPNDGVAGTFFNPYTGTNINTGRYNKDWYIRLGGTIKPDNSMQSGAYSAPFILTISFTAN